MTVTMEVTIPQALTLQTMFEYYNYLSSIGSSRMAGFYADGDGNFHPKVKCEFSEDIPELTDELKELALVTPVFRNTKGDNMYDFDSIAWKIGHE